jgi:hypothetical protein
MPRNFTVYETLTGKQYKQKWPHRFVCISVRSKVNVNVTLEQAMIDRRGNTGIALLHL